MAILDGARTWRETDPATAQLQKSIALPLHAHINNRTAASDSQHAEQPSEMPSRPQHDWPRYLRFVSLFLLGHVAAHLALGGVSPGWVILSAGAFGLALGVSIGQAEYYTDGYESMTLICPVFTCGVGLLLGFIVVAGAAY